ncbi:MAG: hypothetical protein HYY09_03435 [Firmicutes bacterium]|nr:hypothetical protein [Bacillota bacterium]
MYGWAGKILYVNLTSKEISTIPTEKYADQYIGGFGIGAAIYWDLVASRGNPQPGAFDPSNIVSVMAGPLCGAGVPGASRGDVSGRSPQPYPFEMFSRSSFGGHFTAMLKMAGWDGVVVQGRSEKPVYIYIENSRVEIRDAEHLWGLFGQDAQLEIYKETVPAGPSWKRLRDGTETTQPIAILAAGPAGENLCREGNLIHEGGHAAGQMGFGAVLGSKNCKAIGVIGTGSVKVADPKKLLELVHQRQQLWFRMEKPNGSIGSPYGGQPGGKEWEAANKVRQGSGCHACPRVCKGAFDTLPGQGSQMVCMGSYGYAKADLERDKRERGVAFKDARVSDAMYYGAQALNRYGLNSAYWAKDLDYNWIYNTFYMEEPEEFARVAPGLDMTTYGTKDWIDTFLDMIVHRKNPLGKALAEGWRRGLDILGKADVLERNWRAALPWWHGAPHHRDPRAQYHWGIQTLLWNRDHDKHNPESLQGMIVSFKDAKQKRAMELIDQLGQKYPSTNGTTVSMKGLTANDENLYTKELTSTCVYHRHLNQAFLECLPLCCTLGNPMWFSPYTEDQLGGFPDLEVQIYNAVTGRNETFADLIHKGRRVAYLTRAINVLDGVHRDLEVFSPYQYDTRLSKDVKVGDHQVMGGTAFMMVDGKFVRTWPNRSIDRAGTEQVKTWYFEMEGWDSETGWPTRRSLEAVGIGDVADVLKQAGKLGG